MRVLACLALAACGGTPPQAVPRPQEPPAVPKPAPVTCAEAGTLLRGTVEDPANGPSKEAAIARACRDDHWPDAVVQCVGAQTHPGTCIAELDQTRQASYGRALQAWVDAHPGETSTTEVTGWQPPPPPRFFTCNDNLGAPASYAPELTVLGDDRTLAEAMRRAAIQASCVAGGWDQPTLKCMQDQPAQQCRALMAPAAQKVLADKLAEIDAVIAKVAVARKKPANLACAKVVAVHYADAAWKGKLADQKPADRNKAIAESRAAMTKACTDESWSENLRACIAVEGGDACLVAAGTSPIRWGFPALATTIHTGIPECDTMLVHFQAYADCPKLPQSQRDAARQAAHSMIETYTQMAKEPTVGKQCEQIDKNLLATGQTMGCPI